MCCLVEQHIANADEKEFTTETEANNNEVLMNSKISYLVSTEQFTTTYMSLQNNIKLLYININQ